MILLMMTLLVEGGGMLAKFKYSLLLLLRFQGKIRCENQDKL
ncbi:hypothetical protein GCM10023116_20900 [Kistimonas scapharcae]|uniref:Uncharacterized protein n=1 Tax=Kistimonas scapharcae TaxID=1036133 RepID=A0ABP8V1D4_9GAMM